MRRSRKKLTPKQEIYFEKIKGFRAEHGYMPTLAEIGRMLGLGVGGGQYAVKSLISKGVTGLLVEQNMTKSQAETLSVIKGCMADAGTNWTTARRVAEIRGVNVNVVLACLARLRRKGFVAEGKVKAIIRLTKKGERS